MDSPGRQLRSLSPAQLADIGLERGQIDAVATGLLTRSGEAVVQPKRNTGCGFNLARLFQLFEPSLH